MSITNQVLLDISIHISYRAYNISLKQILFLSIPTHTSLAGRDITKYALTDGIVDFYSHVPRGT